MTYTVEVGAYVDAVLTSVIDTEGEFCDLESVSQGSIVHEVAVHEVGRSAVFEDA